MLFLGEGYFVNKLLAIDGLDLHVNPIGFATALILTNTESLPSFRRALVDDVELNRWMKLEEITENKLGLRFTVRLRTIVERYINGLIQEP